MKKRLLSSFLAAALAVTLFAGCGGGDDKNKGGNAGGTQGGAGDSGEGISAEIDMTEDPYTVAIQVVTLPGSDFSAYEADMEAAINEITLPAINCNVDIQFVWISEIANTTSMAIAGNEKVDLIHVATVQTLSTMVGSEMLYDMNEDNLLQNRGPVLTQLFSDILNTGEVNGQQLAVPAKIYNAAGSGIAYNKKLADEAGIEIPEKITFDQLDEILAKFHEAYPDKYAYYSGSGELGYLGFMQQYDRFGSEASYGVVLDHSNPVVENLYATDLFRDYCLRTFKWTKAGIQPGDPTDTSTAQDYFNAEKLLTVVASINPEQKLNWSQYDVEAGWAFLVEPQLSNSFITEYMWGIAANSERPDKAMDFLNYMYENPDVSNILMNGLEGVNYEKAEGSDRIINLNGTYTPMFLVAGDTSKMLIKSPATEDYLKELEEFEGAAEISPLCGYMFDDSEFQTESSVIYSTIMEYLPRLQNGMCESEEATLALIDEFNQKLEASGISDVIAANQEQLDAYLSAQ